MRVLLKRFFGRKQQPKYSIGTAPPKHKFVAKWSPVVYEEKDLGYPEGEFAEAWERFKEARQMLEPFRAKFDKEFQAADWKGHYNFNLDIKARVRGKTYSIYHSESELFDWLLHKSSCPKRDDSNQANGWEYVYQGRIREFRTEMAGYLLDNSTSLRKILTEQQGIWWEYLQSQSRGWLNGPEKTVYERPEYLSEELFDHLWRTNAMVFELLVPNFYLHLESTAKRFGIKLQRVRGIERYVPDAHDRMRQLIQEVVDEINEHREECKHFDDNVCVLCGLQVKPNLAGNLRFNLPNEVCAWCLKVLDYHALPVLSAGKTREELAQLCIDGFRLAVKTFNFPYWRSPSLSTKMLVSLGLRTKTPLRIREFSAVIAGMPRELPGFDSPLHFMKAAGYESLAHNPKSRGKKSISTCNHICLSLGERDICEYLAASGFEHTREPSYGPLTGAIGVTEFGGMRGDFLVGKTVIEFAGLAGNAEYDAKMELKQKLCREYGIDLIVVLPSDLARLEVLLTKERLAT